MLRNTMLIVCLALAVLTVGCANAPAPPPPDTRAADVQVTGGRGSKTDAREFGLRETIFRHCQRGFFLSDATSSILKRPGHRILLIPIFQ